MSQNTSIRFLLKTGFTAAKTKNIFRGRPPPTVSALPIVLCKFALIAYVLLAVCQLLKFLVDARLSLIILF